MFSFRTCSCENTTLASMRYSRLGRHGGTASQEANPGMEDPISELDLVLHTCLDPAKFIQDPSKFPLAGG